LLGLVKSGGRTTAKTTPVTPSNKTEPTTPPKTALLFTTQTLKPPEATLLCLRAAGKELVVVIAETTPETFETDLEMSLLDDVEEESVGEEWVTHAITPPTATTTPKPAPPKMTTFLMRAVLAVWSVWSLEFGSSEME
jgi:hypothetical protein